VKNLEFQIFDLIGFFCGLQRPNEKAVGGSGPRVSWFDLAERFRRLERFSVTVQFRDEATMIANDKGGFS